MVACDPPTTKAIKKSSEIWSFPVWPKSSSWFHDGLWNESSPSFISFTIPWRFHWKAPTLCCTSNWNYHQFPKPFAIVSFFGWNRTWNKMQDHTIFSHRNTRPETIPEGIIGIIFPILGARWKTGEAAWRLKFFAFSPVFCQSQLVKIRHKGLQFRVF